MANERMYILHIPSGQHAYIAKRMGWGWYDFTLANFKELCHLVEIGEIQGDQDAFCLTFDSDDPDPALIVKAD